MPEADIKQGIDELIAEYRERDRGLLILEIAQGFQMVTNPLYAKILRKFSNTATSNKLSMPALRHLRLLLIGSRLLRQRLNRSVA